MVILLAALKILPHIYYMAYPGDIIKNLSENGELWGVVGGFHRPTTPRGNIFRIDTDSSLVDIQGKWLWADP
jgi:hypothetical protein